MNISEIGSCCRGVVNPTLLQLGIGLLRLAIGEEAVTHLVRSDVIERKAAWRDLLQCDDPKTKEAVAYVLDGLGVLEGKE